MSTSPASTHHPKPGLESGVPPGTWPRYLNIALAAWLFISAFAWPHDNALRMNTWIVAVLMFASALWAVRMPNLRYANTVLAGWLFVSSLGMYQHAPTAWNNVLVAVVMFVVSLVPSGGGTAGSDRRARL